LTSEFCGGISPGNSGVSDFSVLLRPHDLMISLFKREESEVSPTHDSTRACGR
jgi:hypothetical protein